MRIALIFAACGVAAFVMLAAWYKPVPSCAKLEARATEAQAAIRVCSGIPGCQIHLDDILKVRADVVAAQKCKAAE